jgi:FkbM family methyltransferase
MQRSRIKRLLRRALCVRPANTVLRALLKSPPLSRLAPPRIVRRIPVVGRIVFQLPNSRRLMLDATGQDRIATRLYWDGIDGYEPETFRVFVSLLKGARVFLDIGANTGIFALYAAMDDPLRRVHAFEPLPEVAECIRRAAVLNGLNNLWVEPAAVGDRNGEATLYVPERADTSFPTDTSTRPGFRENTRTIVAPAVTLDSFVADRRLEGVDLIKVDTESTEPLVLAGGLETLRREKPFVICEVLHGRTERDIEAALRGLSYRFYWMTDAGLVERPSIEGDPTHKYLNYLLVPEDRVPELRRRALV